VTVAARRICETCGTVGRPKTYTKGNIWIELALWLLFCGPGLIYTIWRLTTRQRGCPVCAGKMLDTSTPRGLALLAQYHPSG
jgi:hypothetical protein